MPPKPKPKAEPKAIPKPEPKPDLRVKPISHDEITRLEEKIEQLSAYIDKDNEKEEELNKMIKDAENDGDKHLVDKLIRDKTNTKTRITKHIKQKEKIQNELKNKLSVSEIKDLETLSEIPFSGVEDPEIATTSVFRHFGDDYVKELLRKADSDDERAMIIRLLKSELRETRKRKYEVDRINEIMDETGAISKELQEDIGLEILTDLRKDYSRGDIDKKEYEILMKAIPKDIKDISIFGKQKKAKQPTQKHYPRETVNKLLYKRERSRSPRYRENIIRQVNELLKKI